MPLTRNIETLASKFTQRIARDGSIMFCFAAHGSVHCSLRHNASPIYWLHKLH